jgi:hypothetical protein
METTDALKKLDSLLNEIEIKCDPPIGGPECHRFSVDCLSLIRHKLPPVAEEAFLRLTEYLEEQAPFSQ